MTWGVRIFYSMREVLKLHLESGSDGSEPSFRRSVHWVVLHLLYRFVLVCQLRFALVVAVGQLRFALVVSRALRLLVWVNYALQLLGVVNCTLRCCSQLRFALAGVLLCCNTRMDLTFTNAGSLPLYSCCFPL